MIRELFNFKWYVHSYGNTFRMSLQWIICLIAAVNESTQVWIFQKDQEHYSSSNISTELNTQPLDKMELLLHALDKCSWPVAICIGTPVAFPKSFLTFQVTSFAWSQSTAYTYASFRNISHLFLLPPIWRSISLLLYTLTKQEIQPILNSWWDSKKTVCPGQA